MLGVGGVARDFIPRGPGKERTFIGREELGQFLEQAGLPQDQIAAAFRRIHEGLTTSIPNVALEERRLNELGLRTTSGASASLRSRDTSDVVNVAE
jgi:hypothetical protein